MAQRSELEELLERIAALSPGERDLLERRLRASDPPAAARAGNAKNGSGDAVVPVSLAQRRLWYLERLEPGTPLFHIARALRLRGRLDRAALNAALDTLVDRHEALRTTFSMAGGEPVRRVHPPRPLGVPVVDVDSAATHSGPALKDRLEVDARRPFALDTDLMVRATLYRIGDEDHVLLLVLHHLACDGWSLRILLEELSRLYTAYHEGKASPLASVPCQYADHCRREREKAGSEKLRGRVDWWREKLKDAPAATELPTDAPRPPRQSREGAFLPVSIPESLRAQVDRLGGEAGVTRATVFLAAFLILLRRWTGATDLVIGTPFSGRRRQQIFQTVGFFVETIPLRVDLSGDPEARVLFGRVQHGLLEAIEHGEVPFDQLVQSLRCEQDASRHPLFQILFNAPPDCEVTLGDLDVSLIPVDLGVTGFDLELTVSEADDQITGFIYNQSLFSRSTIERIGRQFLRLLEELVADPGRRLSALRLLPDDEWDQVARNWNQTAADYPRSSTVSEVFERAASRFPDKAALVFQDRGWTYRQLNKRANQIARCLRARGVGPDQVVGLYLGRSFELIAGILGILKAGGAYLPLELEAPADRIRSMLADAAATLILSNGQPGEFPWAGDAEVIDIASTSEELDAHGTENLPATTRAENLAYILFTSGSTGRPKGVEVCHRSIVRLVHGTDYATFGPERVFLQLAPIAFDASTFEIWGALLHGATLVIAPEGPVEFAELERLLQTHSVTTLWLTASLFNHLIETRPSALAGVEELLTGGEALSVKHVAMAQARLGPGVQIINGYGPTEGTTFTCCYRIPHPLPAGLTSIPIGRPIANTTVYILDDQGQFVPIGAFGELYVGGDGVARRYLNCPELDRERFVPDSFGGVAGSRLYRTGDYCRWRADRLIEFQGRRDRQVKLRGFRIELDEIEARLASHPDVAQSVVSLREDRPGDKRLVAYVVGAPKSGGCVESAALARHLGATLPGYMIPSAFVCLRAMPLTASGKVDRRVLPPPDARPNPAAFVAPRNPLEERIAAVWRKCLGRDEVGVHDSFFVLGGHSLLALTLLAGIEQELGWTAPLAALFTHPTIAQMAQLAAPHLPAATIGELVVPIQPTGDRPPLWCLHCGYGFLHHYRRLGQSLDPGQPVLGIQPMGLDGSLPQPDRVEDFAARYLEEIRRRQPTGPYRLCGYSFGGVVASELACQLAAMGHTVDFVALFDSHLYHRESVTARTKRHLAALAGLSLAGGVAYLWKRAIGNVRTFHRDSKRLAERHRQLSASHQHLRRGAAVPIALQGPRFFAHSTKVWRAYQPRRFAGRLLLFRQLKRSWYYRDLPDLGWAQVSDQLEIIDIPGKHGDMLLEPHVNLVARRLAELL